MVVSEGQWALIKLILIKWIQSSYLPIHDTDPTVSLGTGNHVGPATAIKVPLEKRDRVLLFLDSLSNIVEGTCGCGGVNRRLQLG